MRIFYKNGFYFEGINNYIPSGAIEISQEYHNQLLQDMSNGRIIVADENGYPLSIIPEKTLEEWKEEKYKEIDDNFRFIVKECPVQYTNELYYLPEYVNDYINLLPKYFEEDTKLSIWDASGKEENVRKFNKEELIDLIKFLNNIYEKAYQNKKIKESELNDLNKIDESFSI